MGYYNTYIQGEDGHKYEVQVVRGRKFRRYYKGKSWPLTTQCTVRKDGFVIGVGESIKHQLDTDNPKYGLVSALKKAFNQCSHEMWKSDRTKIWSKIIADFEKISPMKN